MYFFAPQALDDSVIIVGSETMVLKSVDRGKTWTKLLSAELNTYFSVRSVY